MPVRIDPVELTERVKGEARRLGFDLVGVTNPDPPAHLDVFERWLGAGRHGEMGYLAVERSRARRAHPRQILPECQSILVLGANCRGSSPPDGSGRARIAAYARGEDYHTVLLERMKSLVAFIRRITNRQDLAHHLYTDTGPVLERELAQRAGLGWIGKNTCLINPARGSHFLLAEIFLGIGLVPDRPFSADRCGSCTRCIEACPTTCILPDRTLDATRCISYLTIELKGSIPQDLRAAVGDWVFGCDVCQAVCPWNVRFSQPTVDPAFQPGPGLEDPRPEDFLELQRGTWKDKLRRSPLLRAKRHGLVRNASIVAGNQHRAESIRPLSTLLHDDADPIVRAHAAWALGRISGPTARRALLQASLSEEEPQVAAEIDSALRFIDGSSVGER